MLVIILVEGSVCVLVSDYEMVDGLLDVYSVLYVAVVICIIILVIGVIIFYL